MRRFERNGRWCEVSDLRLVFHGDVPCYEVDGRGDFAYYIGSGELLTIEERQDGWTVKYLPGDEDFEQYARNMVELGAWR